MALSRSSKFLIGAFVASGTVHLGKPEVYEPLMPAWVPAHREVILASGVAELACAAGLAVPRTRRVAGWATAALFVAVFPGNVQMALDAGDKSATYQAITYARLPLQVPLIVWAVSIARRGRRG